MYLLAKGLLAYDALGIFLPQMNGADVELHFPSVKGLLADAAGFYRPVLLFVRMFLRLFRKRYRAVFASEGF